jgi:adenine-specific DNA-methyltransferase
MEKEKKFYSLLQDLFIGAKLEGDSGYVNLMNIKTDYFNKIKEKLEREVKNKFDNGSPEDLYEKLYTFFDSYFSNSGSIFFSSTPDYKNIYTKVYNPREDVSLFWKTSKLYYVKSEANYRTIKNLQLPNESEVAFDFHFDASLLKHKKANEKKELEFYFTGIKIKEEKKVIKFQVFYKNDNDIEKLKEITKINKKEEVIKYILENSKKLRSKITLKAKYLDLEKLDEKGRKNYTKADLLVIENQGFEDELTVYIAITKIDEIEKYLRFKGVALTEVDIEKAFKVYKKQSEIDYFIHKDAKGFLREQFDLYVYEHLLGQKNLLSVFNQEALDREKKIKEIAYLVIDYIGNFEDELKKIWLKPKFVRKSNYVVTLDRMISKKNGFKIIQEILNHKGIEGQIKEWKELSIVDKDFKTEFIVKDNKINKSWEKLPIDTKYFKDLELEIIGLFENLDEELDGRLIKSENFQALNTLKPKYKGEIQTIYIDPPFNTGDDFDYIDRFQDSTWLSIMEDRLELGHNYLKKEGSIYLHLDYRANYYGRLLLNKIFTKENLLNEIIYAYRIQGIKTNAYANKHDTIFIYTKTNPRANVHIFKLEKEIQKYEKPFIEVQIIPANYSEITEKEINKIFKLIESKKTLPNKYKNLLFNNYFSETFVRDVWDHDKTKPLISGSSEYLDFKTQKSEGLLCRIINNSSNIGELILDFFAGSGTTMSVAHKLNRKWIGIEFGEQFYNKALPRLKNVLFYDENGISKEIDCYKGGGFFKYYELEQYEDALKKAFYNPIDEELENIDFSLSEKQAKIALDIDFKKEKAKFVFEKLYPDVDIPETISNLFGKKIKKIKKDKVIFIDDSEVNINNLDFENYKPLKKLIYW